MRVGIASDHRGYKVKEKLKKYFVKKSIEFVDYGTDSEEIVDYPVFAASVCKGVISGEVECGILICGTGIGMSLASSLLSTFAHMIPRNLLAAILIPIPVPQSKIP